LTICNSSADKTIKVWDIAARAAVFTIPESQEVWAVSWQPSSAAASGGAFVAGGEDGFVRWMKAAGTS
jgi:WD repeat-containing protein 61